MSKIKILVVEDNHIISEELKLRLESLDYEVCGVAHRGIQAIEIAKTLKPNLVLMDIVLNDDMDGIEAAKIIGEQFHIPIVYLTAYADDDTISKAKFTNPYGYIIKPFNEVILKSSIEIALNNFELENKVRENEALLSTTLMGLEEGIFTTDKLGKIIYMNVAAENLTGYTLDECKEQSITQLIFIINKKSGETFESIITAVLLNGKTFSQSNSYLLKSKEGKQYHIEISASPLLDVIGIVTGAVIVFKDVTKRIEVELELIEAKNNAEIASRIKSAFLAQMSHEIRTPINAMLSFASLIREEVKEKVDDEVKEHFEILDNAGKRMARMVDLLLNMSELQSGNYKSKIEKTDLYKDIVENIYIEFAQKALVKNIDFNINKLTSNLEAEVDVNATRQTITSLVENAIKYTKRGKVEIRMSRNEENRLTVEVIDTGIGISEEYKKSLFKPFTQEEQGYTRRYEGTGLGLALAKKYCELTTAKLEVESEKSVGSTFRVIF